MMTYPKRRSTPLEPDTNKKLFSYALVAGAGMLAAAQPADAGTIYSGPINVAYTNIGSSIDFNGGGDDLFFTMFFNSAAGGSVRRLGAQIAGANGGVIGYNAQVNLGVSVVSPSTTIGPPLPKKPDPFVNYLGQNAQYAPVMAQAAQSYGSGLLTGPWAGGNPTTRGFLGFKMDVGGGALNFGWVRMDVTTDINSTDISYTIRDWAYNDDGTPIHAGDTPEPGTLGLLALGSVALAAWRRRKKEQA